MPYNPRRRIETSRKLNWAGVLLLALLVFLGSIFFGRWLGFRLLSSRTPVVKAPPAALSEPPSLASGGGGSTPSGTGRQSITAPPLVIPPPVIEPKPSPRETIEAPSDIELRLPKSETKPEETKEEPDKKTPAPKKTESSKPAPSSLPDAGSFKIQVGIFLERDNAQDLSMELSQKGYPSNFEMIAHPDTTYYRVYVGPFGSRQQAQNTVSELRDQGYQVFVVEEPGTGTGAPEAPGQ